MGNATSTPAADAPRVVVIGGGYAGLSVAEALQARTRVTLIDPKPHFHHLLGATRALAAPGFEHAIHIPRDRLLRGCTLLVGAVTRVDYGGRAVHLLDAAGAAASVPFDFVVVATGLAYASPGFAPLDGTAASLRAYAAVRAALAAARHVVVVGGGSVGAEVAGEAAAAHPGVRFTLLHSGDRLISSKGANGAAADEPAISDAALARLKRLGVAVHLNTRVARPSGAAAAALAPVAPHVLAGDCVLATAAPGGATFACDLQIWTAGAARANTGFLEASDGGLAGALEPRTGELRVDAQLRAPGFPRLFGAGDVAASGHPKMALVVERCTAAVVAGNVLAAARVAAAGGDVDGGAPLPGMRAAPAWTTTAMIVVLSPTVGFGKLGPLWLPDAVVARAKGRDKLAARYHARLGYTAHELQQQAQAQPQS